MKNSPTRFNHRRWLAPITLSALFLLSVIARWPFINQPLGSHGEWLSSTVLRTMEIWEREGAWKTYRILPIMSYPGKANYHIETPAESAVSDSLGRRYYVSYPPLAYIVPYLVLRGVGSSVGVLPLQVFSLVLHFVCACLIYLLVVLILRQRGSKHASLAAMIGATTYLFSPVTLWYQSNVYMSDMFVQPLFILGIYLCLRIQMQGAASARMLAALGALTFLMVYSEWLGVFFAFAVFLYGVYRWRTPAMRWMAIAVIVGTILAMLLTVMHYSQIDGFAAFRGYVRTKFLERSALSDRYTSRLSLTDWAQIIQFYRRGYFPGTLVYLALTGFAALVFTRSRPGQNDPLFKSALFLTIVPVVLHHLIFFNFTYHHEFSTLKTAVLLSLLSGVFSALVLNQSDRFFSRQWQLVPALLVCLLGLLCWANVRTLRQRIDFDAATRFRDSGRTINELTQSDEVAFLNFADPLGPYPQLVWYAKRNLAVWRDERAALQLMNLNGSNKGIVFTMSLDLRITKIERLVKQGDGIYKMELKQITAN